MIDLEKITAEFKVNMQQLYGERLDKVILYGSYARGDFHENSDIDFLVVLKDAVKIRWQEMDRIRPLKKELQNKYNTDIQAMPVSQEYFLTGKNPFLYFVRKEGKTI